MILARSSSAIDHFSRKTIQIEVARTLVLMNRVDGWKISKWRTMQSVSRRGFFEPALSHHQGAKPNRRVYGHLEEIGPRQSTKDQYDTDGLLARFRTSGFRRGAISDELSCFFPLAPPLSAFVE